MAQSISLTSGSILNGSPIVATVEPYAVPSASGTPSVHRIVLEIECGMTGGSLETIKMSTPVLSESGNSRTQNVDISSALRTFRDSYQYTPEAVTYPVVKFKIKYYDEYIINGDYHATTPIFYPNETDYLCTIFGAFTDMERLTAGGATKSMQKLTRKPTSLPEVVAVGETYAHAPAYPTPQPLHANTSLAGPTSVIANITTPGSQTVDGHPLYALPADKKAERQVFRFINGYGVLESVSVPRVYKKQVNITSTPYVIARQETFNTFSRSTVRKQNDREAWQFSTDPMDEHWMSWYIHEFLMAEHMWMEINGTWLACSITPEEEITLHDDTERTMYSLAFSVQLDINGSPIL